MNRKLKIALIVILMILFGYSRDSLFIHINAQLGVLEQTYEQFRLPFLWSFLEGMSINALIYFKWIATLVFFVMYYGIGLLIVKWFFPTRKNFWIVTGTFAFVFMLSTLSIFMGILFKDTTDQSYYFARWLMGSGQSPILIMMLTLVFMAEKMGWGKKF